MICSIHVKVTKNLYFHVDVNSVENLLRVETKYDENQNYCLGIKPAKYKPYHVEAKNIEDQYLLIQIKLVENIPFRVEVKSEKPPYRVKAEPCYPLTTHIYNNNNLPICFEVKSPESLPFRFDTTYVTLFNVEFDCSLKNIIIFKITLKEP